MLKEITVFSYGDSKKISTWSNVPFMLTKHLEIHGVKVNRVNVKPNKFVNGFFNLIINIFINRRFGRSSYEFIRTPMYLFITNQMIRFMVKRYHNSEVFLFMNFDFSAKKYTKKMSIQFGDWTYRKYIDYFLSENVSKRDLKFINYQEKTIKNSDLIFPLFPGTADELNGYVDHNKVKYLGNVINSVVEPEENSILTSKLNSNKIIFIGSKKYLDGARILLDAFLKLKKRNKNVSLHFIGLSGNDLPFLPEDVYCYGYLDKSIEGEGKIYYDLLRDAKCFVNPSPKWSSFSASVEAMYFYTPTIVPLYDEFVNTFGVDFGGGAYWNSKESLDLTIEKVINSEKYVDICHTANALVSDFTWDSYIKNMIKIIDVKLLEH